MFIFRCFTLWHRMYQTDYQEKGPKQKERKMMEMGEEEIKVTTKCPKKIQQLQATTGVIFVACLLMPKSSKSQKSEY